MNLVAYVQVYDKYETLVMKHGQEFRELGKGFTVMGKSAINGELSIAMFHDNVNP